MAVEPIVGFRLQLAAGRACCLHAHRGWEWVRCSEWRKDKMVKGSRFGQLKTPGI